MLQSFVSKLFKKEIGWRYSRTAPMGKTGRKKNVCLFFRSFVCFFILFVHAAARGGTCAFTLKNINTLDKKNPLATIDLRSRHRTNSRPTNFVSGTANECRWRPWRCQVDPSSRGREVARGVLRSSPKTWKKLCFFTSEMDVQFLSVFYTRASKCFCIRRLAGARHASPAVLWTLVTGGSVGVPNERALFRFHDAVVSFVDRCLSRTRNLADIRVKHLAEFFSGRSWPNIWPGMFFSFFFPSSLELFWCQDLCSSWVVQEILCRASLKFKLFVWKHRVSISIGLTRQNKRKNILHQI